MEVIAKARHIRMSPRKVRLIADLIRGMDVGNAASQLRFYRKAAARPVYKVLMSAVANAEHNFKMDGGDLYVKSITVDNGPVLKRWRARAFGRAAPIRKRSAHITVVLGERKIAGTPKGVESAVMASAKGGSASGGKPAKAAEKKTEKRAASKTKKAGTKK